MGNASSSHDDHPNEDDELDPFDGIDTLGYRVLGVQPNSPASHAGLVSFLDFLVGANQRMLLGSGEDLEEGEEYDDVDLPLFLEENKDKAVEFCEYKYNSMFAVVYYIRYTRHLGYANCKYHLLRYIYRIVLYISLIPTFPSFLIYSGLEYQKSTTTLSAAHTF
jgi:hypothetical protein